MSPIEVGEAIALFAFELVERELEHSDEQREALRIARDRISDAKLMLRVDAQSMLDARHKKLGG